MHSIKESNKNSCIHKKVKVYASLFYVSFSFFLDRNELLIEIL